MMTEHEKNACIVHEEHDNEEESWDDWVEDANGESETFCCLFCDQQLNATEQVHSHLQQNHAFGLKQYLDKFQLDTYGIIQFINYLRTQHAANVAVIAIQDELKTHGASVFLHDQYLKPVMQDDALLYCLDEDESDDDDAAHESKPRMLHQKDQAIVKDDMIAQLQRENHELKQQMMKYARLVREFVAGNEDSSATTPIEADNDTYYFDSYSHVGIHREMITDRVRTDGYRNAILNNAHLFENKIVLDVGCGTGILSMFAAQAGAKQVIGIDCSEMGDVAREIVVANGFGDVITILRGKVEEIELPVPKVDIIVSEWMGYCLLYESMLDTVLFARDKWLVDGGHLFPDKCSMFLQGAVDSTQRFGFWDNVYGFNMAPIKQKISLRDAFIDVIDATDIVTSRAMLQAIDIDHVTYDELDFRSDFVLTIDKTGTLDGFVSSFDIGFERDCRQPEYFTTGVEGTPTHWQQVFFHLETPLHVTKGEQVIGTWSVRRNAENPRFLDVEIAWKRENDDAFHKQSYRIH